jgi:hypothetical protein|tara:strand:+ start:1150 stop:1386 length:237 start_codon:yes stop_codon:yes gene_type:complete
MFEFCKHIDRICAHASKSTYNPESGMADGPKKTFCGVMNGYDCRAGDLKMCWLDMSAHQKSLHKKKMKLKYQSYKLAR